jgi:RNA polymerase sigma-70 factor, ECF subfamily
VYPVATPHPKPLSDQASADASGAVVALTLPISDDFDLVTGVIERNPKAVAQLYDRYAGLVRSVLIHVLGSARDVEDVTQDTFLTIVGRCSTLRDPSTLRSFVVSVAIRVARNELRKRALRRFVGMSRISPPPVVPSHDPEARQRVRRVYEMLEKLDTDARIAFVLRHVESYELTEGAEVCGCSLATFKRRLSRAEKRFDAMCRSDPILSTMIAPGRKQP